MYVKGKLLLSLPMESILGSLSLEGDVFAQSTGGFIHHFKTRLRYYHGFATTTSSSGKHSPLEN